MPYSIKDKFQLIPKQGSEQGTDGIIQTKDGKYYSIKLNLIHLEIYHQNHFYCCNGRSEIRWLVYIYNCYSTPSTFKRKFQKSPLEILFNTLDSLDNAFFLDLIEFCKEKNKKKIKVEKGDIKQKQFQNC